MDIYPSFGAMVAAKRRERGLTQATVAEACGVSENQVSNWETNNRGIRKGTLKLLVAVLRCDREEQGQLALLALTDDESHAAVG